VSGTRWGIVPLAAVVALAGFAAQAARASGAGRSLAIYAVATRAQFTDHSDDRKRGELNNPFNADTKLPKKVVTRAGDEALFSFKLYSDAAHKHQIGSASYSCTYNSAHKALCEADFELKNGAMFASGPADFDTTTFTLAVSGGSGSYVGARGQVSSAPAAKDAHRLTFLLR
jgi:hypothetical protein